MLMLGVQVLCVISFLFPVTYPEGFGGDRFRQVFWEGTGRGGGGTLVYATLWVQGKVWWGISDKAPRSSMNLVL